jgi:FkbM family methyltransferase
MAHKPTLARRAGIGLLRLPSRTLEIPGWFPLVVERAHRYLVRGDAPVEFKTVGVRMRLDLNDYTQRRIFYNAHEHREVEFVRRFLRPNETVVDVGATVGLFTLVSARAVAPSGKTHSFEPVPGNFESLAENVRLNGFEHVLLNAVAVGRESGELQLGLPEVTPDRGQTSGMYTSGAADRTITVPKIDLGEYVDEHLANTPIRLVKVDVEGMEPEVLLALERRLQERPPDAFIVEVNVERLRANGWEVADVARPLERAGYRFFTLKPRGRLRPLSSLHDPDEQKLQYGSSVLKFGFQARHWLYNVVALAPAVDGSRARG